MGKQRFVLCTKFPGFERGMVIGMNREEHLLLTSWQKQSGERGAAKYYEPLYFCDGHTILTDENQNFINEVLDKNSAVGVYGIFEEEDYPIYCISGFALTDLGYSIDELLETTKGKFINLVYEKDRQGFRESYHEKDIVEKEFRLVTKKQKVIWVHSYGRRSKVQDGRIVYISSIRIIDASIRRESELLTALSKEYQEIIYIDEKRGKCQRVKSLRNYDKPLGTIEELHEEMRKHLDDVHPEDYSFAGIYEKIFHLSCEDMDVGGDYKATYRVKLEEEYVWLQCRAILGGNQKLDTGHIILTFKRVDNEVQRELDANHILSESLAKAEEASRIKNQFLSRMSHDLRTPINGIMGMVEIIKRNLQNPDKVLGCSQKIALSCQHLMSLVNDVLDMSNFESGKVEFEDVAFDFIELVEKECENSQIRANEAGLVFYAQIEPFRHHTILGSPKHIRQIFANILDNAIKYNKSSGTIRMWGREISDNDRLAVYEFVIEDTGWGMEQEFLKRIFEPFEQESNDARTTYAGVGLGMSIVKKMIENMNGDISINSIKNIGTKVRITLPLRVCKKQELQEEERPINLKGMKVLLVEDNELNMEIAQFLLEDIGTEVYSAVNGKIAVDMFAQSEYEFYDMVFMDLMMPVMDGYEATRQIRAMERKDAQSIPIIALSANVLDEDIKRSKMAGMNEHLPKPIDESQVLNAIVKYTRKIV